MRKWLVLIAFLLLPVVLAACGGPAAEEAAAPPRDGDSPLVTVYRPPT
jgi:hypothetical protein